MIETEELVLKVKALEDMAASALKPLEAARKRIRTWLTSMKEPMADVDGTIKAYLQITQAKEVVDSESVAAQFEDLLRLGRYTQAEILDLVRSKILVVGKTDAIVGAIALKIKGYVAPTRMTAAGSPESSPLRFNVTAAGRFEGLKSAVKGVVDLEGSVLKVLDNPLPSVPIQAGKTAISRR